MTSHNPLSDCVAGSKAAGNFGLHFWKSIHD